MGLGSRCKVSKQRARRTGGYRYAVVFEFRYNARHVDDGEWIARAIKAAEGKRLTCEQQLAG